MRLLLILPSSKGGFLGGVSSSGRAGFARLGLTTLAALTPEDIDVRILDARVEPVDYNAPVDLVGITGLTSEIPDAYRIADGFREKRVKVVMGGVHVSALPEEALGHADAVVVGEAELVWKELIEDFRKGRLKPIYQASSLVDMKDVPVPRRSLLKKEMYTSFSTIQATRGCPFRCDFCTVTNFFGNKYRCRPIEDVISEIKGLPDKDIVFLDDNIVGRPTYAKELMKALIPLNIRWGSQASITLAKDDELLSLYSRSGGRYVFIGFESLTQKNLEGVHKGWNRVKDYEKAIRKIHRAGIDIIGSFIFGLDHDDTDSFRNVLDFIYRNRIDVAMFNILTPFPGTELFRRLDGEGRIFKRDWSRYHTGDVVYKPLRMSVDELQQGYYWIYRETYSYLNILRRVFRTHRNIISRAALNYSYRRKVNKLPESGRFF